MQGLRVPYAPKAIDIWFGRVNYEQDHQHGMYNSKDSVLTKPGPRSGHNQLHVNTNLA